MSAASSRRFETPAARAKRLTALLASYGFDKLKPPPRLIDADEAAYIAIGDPRRLRAPDLIVDGIMVSTIETLTLRRRAFAARVWLARRLARRSIDTGLAAVWRGTAREDLYGFRLYRRALRQARFQR